MNSTRSPLAAALLAIALVAVTVPFVPSGNADGTNQDTCTRSGNTLIDDWDGYVTVTHPAISSVRVSQALYFHVLGDDLTVLGSSLRHAGNGQDAYVAHFGCNTSSNHDYCLERPDPDGDTEFTLVERGLLHTDQPDIHVQFYGPTLDTKDSWDHNPDVPADGKYCTFNDASNDGPPSGAHYAVIYLESGHPDGLQIGETVPGPYTEDFVFELHKTS